MKKILVTGGDGRFATELKKIKTNYKFIYLNKKQLDILKETSILKAINKYKPNIILHLAALSRPMNMHNNKISDSINLNIIGTCNVVNACIKKKLKLFISRQAIYILEQRVIIKKQIVCIHGIIMDGQNSVGKLLFKCIKTL